MHDYKASPTPVLSLVDHSVMCFGHIIELCSKRIVQVASGEVDDDNDNDDSIPNATTIPSNPPSLPKPVLKARAVVCVI
jgi:hypothetical protein